MNKTFQALLAVTCLVVIACGAWWMLDRSAANAEAERSAQIAAEARSQVQLERCKNSVSAWDADDKAPAERWFGDAAADGIETCRGLIKIDEIKKSKPAE